MQKFKNAFTMIELIFVIVILGILAAVAAPKLIATRDDAKIATFRADLSTAVTEIVAYSIAKKSVVSDLSVMSNIVSARVHASKAILSDNQVIFKIDGVDCVKIRVEVDATNDDLNVSLIDGGAASASCNIIQTNIDVATYRVPLRGFLVVE